MTSKNPARSGKDLDKTKRSFQETLVVNAHTTKTWDVMVDRSSPFGNPFKGIGKTDAIAKYKVYFLDRMVKDPEFRRRVLELRGKRLGCWCAPAPCHGAVIAEWLETNQD